MRDNARLIGPVAGDARPRWVLLALLAVLPPVAAYATQGTVVVLALALLAVSRESLGLAGRLAKHPIAIAFGLLVLWALTSSAWAPDPGRAFTAAVRLGLLGVGAVVFAAVLWTQRAAEHGWLRRALLLSIAVMAGLSLVEGLTEGLVSRLFHAPEGFNLSTAGRGATVPVLMMWAAVALTTEARRWALALGFIAVTAVAAALLPVAAMPVAVAVAAAVWLLVLVGGHRMVKALAAAGIALILLMPAVAGRLPAAVHDLDLPQSWVHRVHIWQFVTTKIDEAPVAGLGFDAARVLGRINDQTFVPGTRMQVLPLHPHNGFLQVRLELGLPGALLLAALFFAVAREIWRRAPARPQWAAAAAAALAGWMVIFSISFGAWQNWWVATAMLAFGVVGFAARHKE